MVASGAVQADQFERLLSKSHPKLRLSSGLWPRYLRGDVLPQGALENAKSSLIARLDRVYPGTAEIFNHPVWELFEFDQLIGPKRLRELYLTLSAETWTKFVNVTPSDEIFISKGREVPFWKLQWADAELQRRWATVGGLDAVASCLIEARMGYLSQNVVTFFNSILWAEEYLMRLARDPGFQYEKERMTLLLLRSMCFRLMDVMTTQFASSGGLGGISRMIEYMRERWDLQADFRLTSASMPTVRNFIRWDAQIQRQKYDW